MVNTRNLPEKDGKDQAYDIGKIILSTVGGPAAEIFSKIIASPISKRRDKWMQSIAEDLTKLEAKVDGFSVEKLSENDIFITTVMRASQIAIRNHQEEKLMALKGAVLNSTSPNSPEEDIQLMFLNFIDELTPWHLRIIKFLDNPIEWGKTNNIIFPQISMGGIATILEIAFNELKGRRDFYDQIAKDLYSRGLLGTEHFHTVMTRHGLFQSKTTSMGKQFIQYVTSPV